MSTVLPGREPAKGQRPPLDVEALRRDFPILARKVHDHPLVYLDNAATTQKPASVIEAVADMYRQSYANIHRGVHALSVEATDAYEQTREKVRAFLPTLDELEIEGLVMLEPVEVVRYAGRGPDPDDPDGQDGS